jgi:superfamily II DNA/RNA helicase
VSTDALSRGANLNLSHVVNYDAPGTSETYVHRCGRTARAGSEGEAVTFVTDVGRWWTTRKGCEGGRVEELKLQELEGGVDLKVCLGKVARVLKLERKGWEDVKGLLEEDEAEAAEDSSSVASSSSDEEAEDSE